MTRSVEIPDAAVEAGARAMRPIIFEDREQPHGELVEQHRDETRRFVRAALVAARPYLTPTREAIAEALHDHDHMHTWRSGRCDDACGVAAFQRADLVLALLSTSGDEA